MIEPFELDVPPAKLVDLLRRTGCSFADISRGAGITTFAIRRICRGGTPRQEQHDKLMAFAATRLKDYLKKRKDIERAVEELGF